MKNLLNYNTLLFLSGSDFTDFTDVKAEIDQLRSQLGRKSKVVINNIYKLLKIKIAKYGSLPSVIRLSQTDKALSELGQQKAIGRLIQTCIKIDLLTPVTDELGKSSYKVGSYGKSYYINTDLAEKILTYGDSAADIEKPVNVVALSHKELNAKITAKFEAEKQNILLSTYDLIKSLNFDTYGESVYNALESVSDEAIIAIFTEKFPQINLMQKLDDRYNAKITEEVLKRRANINIRRDRKRKEIKISFREYCDLCKMPKVSENELTRSEFLQNQLGTGYKEFDLKSSIYRITNFINHDVWAERNHDFYLDFAPAYRQYRDQIKLISMYIYFSALSDKQIANQRKVKDLYNDEFTKDICLAICAEIRKNMEKTIGKSLGASVFLHESFVMNYLFFSLTEVKKINACQVYDAIYYDSTKISDDEINNLLLSVVDGYSRNILNKVG